MGIWLIYETVGPVSAEVAASIVGESRGVGGDRRWVLCEGVRFDPFDESPDGHLTGASKVFVRHDDPDDDDPIDGPHDLRVLADALARWSRLHGLTWRLSTEGGAIGAIVDGEEDDQILGKLDSLAEATLALRLEGRRPPRSTMGRPRLRIYRGPDYAGHP